MKKQALLAVIKAQGEVIGQLDHLLAELDRMGVFHGREDLITIRSATRSVVEGAKAEAFDEIVRSL